MGLRIEKLVVATNENDILDRFWKTGYYEKHPVHGREAEGGLVADGVKAHEQGVKETYSPAMDILVSSNFERLLWFLAYQVHGQDSVRERRKIAGEKVSAWLSQLKTSGGFSVENSILEAAKKDFESERVSDTETIETIREVHAWSNPSSEQQYILDPHSAIGLRATLRSIERAPPPRAHHISLSTAHPAKFSHAVELALKEVPGFDFSKILPPQFVGLEDLPKRVTNVKKSGGMAEVRRIVVQEVEAELAGQ